MEELLHRTTTTTGFTLRIVLFMAMFGVLALLISPMAASADELSDVQSELDAKATELQDLTKRVNAAGDEMTKLEDEIDDLVGDIATQQKERMKLQKRISALSKVIYKNGEQLNIVNIMTHAESLSDVVEAMEMRHKMLSEYTELAGEQEKVATELEVAYKEVSARKDKQLEKLDKMRADQEELAASVMALEKRAAELTAAQQAALAEAAAAEAAAAEAYAMAQPGAPDDDSDDSSANSQGNVAGGWQSGVASAYGGSTDETDDPTVPTATGDYVDDYSMGVAVPMAWGAEDYYGRSVEITYNGHTVIATVNDCGGMGGGSRSLDLQPGVFKALGYDECDEWGLREVQYRFL